MDSFLASLNAISSMAIPLLVGILLRVLHILDGRFSPTVSTLIYNVCLPVERTLQAVLAAPAASAAPCTPATCIPLHFRWRRSAIPALF